MTQDELKLVLEALKWCHGGEPCGTAEAIAVVEKALAQPQRKPLTDEEIDHIYTGVRAVHHEIGSYVFARAIEAAHGIKENT